MISNPEQLLDYAAQRTLDLVVEAEQRHYGAFGVTSAIPVMDAEDHLKLLAATNYRPSSALNTRVCSEQALIDNAFHDGDLSLGFGFARGQKPRAERPIEGCLDGMRTLHLCRPCRIRFFDVVGPDFLMIMFNDDEPEPTEALTVGQMIGYHDLEEDYPELPLAKTARDVALDSIKDFRNHLRPLKRPRLARRSMRPEDRD